MRSWRRRGAASSPSPADPSLVPDLRPAGLGIFRAALDAGDVTGLLPAAVRLEGSRLVVGDRSFDLDRVRRLLVVGAGKASGAMAQALERLLGERISDGLVVVKEGALRPTARIRQVEASHPIPDERGLEAARGILELARSAGVDDLVVCLISGGGSALTPLPVPGVSLEEKRRVTRLLLEAGATINELNAVRKHLSAIKGGQLARAAAPAPVVALLLSDVIGDPLDVIASGPTAPDDSTYAGALEILGRFGLLESVPASVRRHLEAGARGEIPETPKVGDPLFDRVVNVLIGNNALVAERAVEEARRQGFTPLLLSRGLQGEAREVARALASIAKEVRASGRPIPPPACLILAGETTVTVRGDGRGGRCQEFCLAAALELQGLPGILVLAAGTDGTDGPTDAAGALANGETVSRARALGLDPRAALRRNDSYTFFQALGDLIVTGATRTNLMDLYLLIISEGG